MHTNSPPPSPWPPPPASCLRDPDASPGDHAEAESPSVCPPASAYFPEHHVLKVHPRSGRRQGSLREPQSSVWTEQAVRTSPSTGTCVAPPSGAVSDAALNTGTEVSLQVPAVSSLRIDRDEGVIPFHFLRQRRTVSQWLHRFALPRAVLQGLQVLIDTCYFPFYLHL